MFIYCMACIISVMIITAVLLRIFIPKLISMKLGQPIYEIGPRWHKSKEGTPTMGGVFFIIAECVVLIVIAIVIEDKSELGRMWTAMTISMLFGVVGMIDDIAKLKKRENQGLTAVQKFTLQLVIAAGYVSVMAIKGYNDTTVKIPFCDISFDLGVFYYAFAIIFICGIVNSVNLTDGIDGLAASVTAVVSGYFTLYGSMLEYTSPMLLGSATFGGCLGFLIYNAHPAKIFMGDTGSLFLGGIVVGLAFLTDSPLLIVICGIVYIIETVSVILQVGYFKLTHGKRLFKMAPFHHHLEKCGMNETTIVIIAVAITIAASVLLLMLN